MLDSILHLSLLKIISEPEYERLREIAIELIRLSETGSRNRPSRWRSGCPRSNQS